VMSFVDDCTYEGVSSYPTAASRCVSPQPLIGSSRILT
jgi:hypothetical protein